jgi:hypothetical protein
MRASRRRAPGSAATAHEDASMVHRLRSAILRSTLLAVTVQLLAVAATAAATGGGDFPRWLR